MAKANSKITIIKTATTVIAAKATTEMARVMVDPMEALTSATHSITATATAMGTTIITGTMAITGIGTDNWIDDSVNRCAFCFVAKN